MTGKGDNVSSAPALVLSRDFDGFGDCLEENAWSHDPLVAVLSNHLSDVEQPFSVFNFRGFFHEETRINTLWHGSTPPPSETSERTVCATNLSDLARFKFWKIRSVTKRAARPLAVQGSLCPGEPTFLGGS